MGLWVYWLLPASWAPRCAFQTHSNALLRCTWYVAGEAGEPNLAGLNHLASIPCSDHCGNYECDVIICGWVLSWGPAIQFFFFFSFLNDVLLSEYLVDKQTRCCFTVAAWYILWTVKYKLSIKQKPLPFWLPGLHEHGYCDCSEWKRRMSRLLLGSGTNEANIFRGLVMAGSGSVDIVT